MGKPAHIREAARKLFILGYPYSRILERLGDVYGGDDVPALQTIYQWSLQNGWKKEKREYQESVKENRRLEMEEMAKARTKRFLSDQTYNEEVLREGMQHVKGHLERGVDPGDLHVLMKTADTAIRRQRIDFQGYDTVQQQQITGDVSVNKREESIDVSVMATFEEAKKYLSGESSELPKITGEMGVVDESDS